MKTKSPYLTPGLNNNSLQTDMAKLYALSRKLEHPQNYNKMIDEAWEYYDKNIAYKTANTECELVTLKGKHDGKLAIKIPITLDDRQGTYRNRLENFLSIEVFKWIFRCEYSSPRSNGYRERII